MSSRCQVNAWSLYRFGDKHDQAVTICSDGQGVLQFKDRRSSEQATQPRRIVMYHHALSAKPLWSVQQLSLNRHLLRLQTQRHGRDRPPYQERPQLLRGLSLSTWEGTEVHPNFRHDRLHSRLLLQPRRLPRNGRAASRRQRRRYRSKYALQPSYDHVRYWKE